MGDLARSGNRLAVAEASLPKDWRQHLQAVHYLYVLRHNETGKQITVYGQTWQVISPSSSVLVADWVIPLVLQDSTVNPEEWTIGCAYPTV